MDQPHMPSIIILGIFGYHNSVKSTDIQDNTLTPMLQELERVPDVILLPSEGNSSIYVGDWAESLHIKTQVFQSDWARHGKVAQRIRDERIQKECTHALVFLSDRSDRLEKYAESLAKKGKIVFTSSSKQCLQILYSEIVAKKQPKKKSDKGLIQLKLSF